MTWITVIGIGEDGLEGLSVKAREQVSAADVLVGGERHLAHVPTLGRSTPKGALRRESKAERLTWQGGFEAACERIGAHKGKRVVVLASGDPLHYGAGATLVRHFGADAVNILPNVGAVSLTAARMGWSLPDVKVVTVHGRPIENLNLYLQSGQRIIALSAGANTPGEVARLLTGRGFGKSKISVFEHLGGDKENTFKGVAESWTHASGADLNTLAIECAGGDGLSRLAGLPDDAFDHDGQLTKYEVRAITLSRLAPKFGQTLWDVGAGAGSIAIEWMRTGRSLRAVAIEQDKARTERIKQNAFNAGVPKLKVVEGRAPDALSALTLSPHAIFVGGAVGKPGMLEAAWGALKPGGRLVANAVTAESTARVETFASEVGGEVTRISVEHFKDGAYVAKRPIVQLFAKKSGGTL